MLISKALFECEKLAGRSTTAGRKIVNDVNFTVPYEKDGDLVQISVHAETFVTSKKPIKPTHPENSVSDAELPSLFPIKYTVSMPQEHIYKLRDVYRK